MKLKRPVLVSGRCDVLKAHCLKSNGGLYYTDFLEFEGATDYLLSHPDECRIMGENGIEYVNENYSWEGIVERLDAIMKKVALSEV